MLCSHKPQRFPCEKDGHYYGLGCDLKLCLCEAVLFLQGAGSTGSYHTKPSLTFLDLHIMVCRVPRTVKWMGREVAFCSPGS